MSCNNCELEIISSHLYFELQLIISNFEGDHFITHLLSMDSSKVDKTSVISKTKMHMENVDSSFHIYLYDLVGDGIE